MASPNPLILLIEDDQQLRRVLRTALATHSYHVIESGTAREGLAQAAGRNPDVVLLDLGLPDGDGLEVARRLREQSRVPIIVLSARGQERDKIAAFDLGADDYLTKPFSLKELLARITVALRHAATPLAAAPVPSFTIGQLRVELAQRRVFRAGVEVHLTPTEYKLLASMVQQAGRVLTHKQLLQAVWGASYVEETHYLRVYMAQLRHKLELDPARPRLLITEPGVGYRLRDE